MRDTQEAISTRNDDRSSENEQAFELLFPPEWGWQQYERTTREFAVQRVVYVYEQHDNLDEQDQAFRNKAAQWYLE